jgi:hypothetical protein
MLGVVSKLATIETSRNAHRISVAFKTTMYTLRPSPRMRAKGSPCSTFGVIGAVSDMGQAMRNRCWPSRGWRSEKNALPSNCTGWMVPADDIMKNPRGSKAASAKNLRSGVCAPYDAVVADCCAGMSSATSL